MSAAGDGAGHVGRVIEGREHHHPSGRRGGPHPLDDVERIAIFEKHVEHNDVGLQFADLPEGFLSRRGLSADSDPRVFE